MEKGGRKTPLKQVENLLQGWLKLKTTNSRECVVVCETQTTLSVAHNKTLYSLTVYHYPFLNNDFN
jgi:hypothetical protein